jgi:hypothetical protein
MRTTFLLKSGFLFFVSTATMMSCTPPPPPFKPVADVKQLMQAVIDPAADIIWEATGTIITPEGTEERAPKNEEEWNVVRTHAMMLTESGNLLMMVPRAMDGGAWMTLSQELVDTGVAALRAAEAKNVGQLFAAGGAVYVACVNCHQQYVDALTGAGP